MEQDPDWLLLQDLNFGLSDINGLTTVQLCLVQFHPEADDVAKSKAELAYWRRRNKAQTRAKTEAKASQSISAVSNSISSTEKPILATESINQSSLEKTEGISASPALFLKQAIPAIGEGQQTTHAYTQSHDVSESGPSVRPQTPTSRSEIVDTSITVNADTGSTDLASSLQNQMTEEHPQQSHRTAQNVADAVTGEGAKVAISHKPIVNQDGNPKDAIAYPGKDEEVRSHQGILKNDEVQEQPVADYVKQRTPIQAAPPAPVAESPLLDRLSANSQPQAEVSEEKEGVQANKRKRGTTPLEVSRVEEPASNRPKTSEATYDRYAKQRRPPSPEVPETEDFRIIDPSDKRKVEHKSSPQPGKKSNHQDELLPHACTQELVCVFVGNIPHDTKEADVRPWLFTSRSLPRPVVVTKLASARSTPNGHQYFRIFFKDQYEAEKAVGLLRKTPFEHPPAQLLVRALKQEPGKVKLYWRDVESWARPYLEDLASKPLSASSSSTPRDEKKLSAQESYAQTKQLDTRPRRSPPRPPSRQQSPVPRSGRYEADRLADRLGGRSTSYDRYETDHRRAARVEMPLSRQDQHQERARDKERAEDLAARVRGADTQPRSENGLPPRPDSGRRASKVDLFRRFDASPPRRRRDYSPERERKRDYQPEERSDLLGRLR